MSGHCLWSLLPLKSFLLRLPPPRWVSNSLRPEGGEHFATIFLLLAALPLAFFICYCQQEARDSGACGWPGLGCSGGGCVPVPACSCNLNYSPSWHHFGLLTLYFRSRVPWRVKKKERKMCFCIRENPELTVIRITVWV